MIRIPGLFVLVALTTSPISAQSAKIKINLDHLVEKASETVNVTLDRSLIEFGCRFISDRDPEAAQVKKICRNLEGIYVRSFEFDKPGQYSQADVDAIYKQVNGWTRIVEVNNRKSGGELTGVYLRQDGEKILGLAVITAEPKQLTVINIAGSISPEEISVLEGHFGIPKLDIEKKKPPKDKTEKKDDD